MNFLNPRTFNEKLQVQKLYNQNPRMTYLADKYLVRLHIKDLGHANILNTLIGAYDRADDIDFATLPQSFVIRCNHSCANNIICEDKSIIDEKQVIGKLNVWMKKNHYDKFLEWSYKNIKPKIMIERHLGSELKDYKFFCFSGSPLYIQVNSDRFGSHTLDIYDMGWNRLNCSKGDKKQSIMLENPHPSLQQMARIATEIASEFNFCRVDFLTTPDAFYFGEATFYPGAGYSPFHPEYFDYLFGKKFNVDNLTIPLRSRLKIGAIGLLDRMGMV
jgi:hypothetical protein